LAWKVMDKGFGPGKPWKSPGKRDEWDVILP